MCCVPTLFILIHLGTHIRDPDNVHKEVTNLCRILTNFVFMQVSYAPQVQNEKVNSYEGAQVWRTVLRGSSDILLIKKLMDDQDISIWSLTPKSAEFLVQSDYKLRVNRILNTRRLNHTVVVMDVQRRVDAQQSDPVLWNELTLRIGHRLNWNEYPTLEIIEEYFDYLSENFRSICEVAIIGNTAENRTIKMVRISNGNPENKAIMIIAGSHAREWISITSALFILDSIVSKFDQLPRHMVNQEWIIIPLLNPDGFKYSHTHDRLWRKNRQELSNCKGVDINRNFEKDWDINGITATDECADNYSGPHPFSEAESLALRNVVNKYKEKLEAVIDLHSYGQLILYPWSAKPGPIKNDVLHKNNAVQMTNAIFNSTGARYKSGVTYNTIYPATGAIIDWIYASGVQQSFAIETGDSGLYGFLLPPDQIETVGKETLAAAKELSKVISHDFLRQGQEGSWF